MSTILIVTLVVAALAALGALDGPLGAVGRAVLLLLAIAAGAAAVFSAYAGFAWREKGAGLLLLLAPVAAMLSWICVAFWRAAREAARVRGLPDGHPDRRAVETRQGALLRMLRSLRESGGGGDRRG